MFITGSLTNQNKLRAVVTSCIFLKAWSFPCRGPQKSVLKSWVTDWHTTQKKIFGRYFIPGLPIAMPNGAQEVEQRRPMDDDKKILACMEECKPFSFVLYAFCVEDVLALFLHFVAPTVLEYQNTSHFHCVSVNRITVFR